MDFGSVNPTTVTVDGSKVTGGSCYFRLDSLTGPIIAQVDFVASSGPYVATIDQSVNVRGIRDLFFTYASGGPGIANVDAFEFSGFATQPTPPTIRPYMEDSNLMVRFDTVSGVSYTVKSSTNMVNWKEVANIIGDGNEAVVPVPIGSALINPVFAIVEAF